MSKLYECPLCGELHTEIEWEIVTINSRRNRYERRRYIPFNSSKVTHKNKRTIYKCPSCLSFSGRLDIKESNINDDDIIKL